MQSKYISYTKMNTLNIMHSNANMDSIFLVMAKNIWGNCIKREKE